MEFLPAITRRPLLRRCVVVPGKSTVLDPGCRELFELHQRRMIACQAEGAVARLRGRDALGVLLNVVVPPQVIHEKLSARQEYPSNTFSVNIAKSSHDIELVQWRAAYRCVLLSQRPSGLSNRCAGGGDGLLPCPVYGTRRTHEAKAQHSSGSTE